MCARRVAYPQPHTPHWLTTRASPLSAHSNNNNNILVYSISFQQWIISKSQNITHYSLYLYATIEMHYNHIYKWNYTQSITYIRCRCRTIALRNWSGIKSGREPMARGHAICSHPYIDKTHTDMQHSDAYALIAAAAAVGRCLLFAMKCIFRCSLHIIHWNVFIQPFIE